jgi:guanylate kinase
MEVIEDRLAKAEYELTFADRFDHVVVNDDLAVAEEETYRIVRDFFNDEKEEPIET